MGREIRFRVWCKEHELMSTPSFMDCKGGKIVDVIGSKCTGNGFVLNRGHWTNCFELMQFTGLKDKNGKKIFEGDILQQNDRIRSVKWDSVNTGFFPFLWEDGLEFDTTLCEIIGNVHQQEHLLDQGEEVAMAFKLNS